MQIGFIAIFSMYQHTFYSGMTTPSCYRILYSVFVGDNLAECDVCEYEYADDMTPDVTMIDPIVVTVENTQIHFTGSKFLPSAHISAGETD